MELHERWRTRYATVGRRLLPYLVLLIVALCVHWTYLVEPGRPFYVDSDLPMTYADFASRYFHAWNADVGGLNFAQFMRIPYVLPLYAVFRTLSVDVTVFVTVLFWLPTYLAMATSFVFFRHFLRRPTGASGAEDGPAGAGTGSIAGDRGDSWWFLGVCLLLAVGYALNPWITKHFAQYYFRVSAAFLPLALLLFVRYVRAGRRRHLVLAALAVVMVSMNPHFLIYFGLLAGSFVLLDGMLSGRPLRTLGRSVGVGACFVVFSLFWLLPFLFVAANGEEVVGYHVGERIVSVYSTRNTPVNLFSFMGGYWPGITEFPWWLFDPVDVYQTLFLAIPVAAFTGLLSSDRDDRLAVIAGVVIVAILALATGYRYGGPVGWLYDRIQDLPFHGVLRAPDRLLAILPILYGYLIGRAILDGENRLVRAGAVTLAVVACLAAVGVSLAVFAGPLGPTELPEDHAHVVEEDYEDTFVAPPRALAGYNPDWLFSREGGIVESLDTHLYARPDSRQQLFNYYLFELIDQGHTAAALDVVRKTGGDHVLVRTDTRNRRGIPPGEAVVERLSDHLDREYVGENLVVFDLDGPDTPFQVVRPTEASRDVDAARHLADEADVVPRFAPDREPDPLLAELDGTRRFHPANLFRDLNERDVLSRPATYTGYEIRGEQRLVPPARDGSLVVRATPLSRSAEIRRETADGSEVFKLGDGHTWTRIDLDGEGRPLTFQGPMYVERLFTTGESRDRTGTPVNVTLHGGGTVTPGATDLAYGKLGSSVELGYRVHERGGFLQVSFEPETTLAGAVTVNATVRTEFGGDRLGVVLLSESGGVFVYGTDERLRPGTQTLTVHLTRVPADDVDRIQFAVFPESRPTRGRLSIESVAVTQRDRPPARSGTRPDCEADPSGPRCEGAARITDVRRPGPAQYEVDVFAAAPYALQFGETYDSLWTAEVSGPGGTASYGARPLYGVTNGFWIDETGTHTVTVRYRPQRWFVVGSIVSGGAMTIAIAGVAFGWWRRRATGRHLGSPVPGDGPIQRVRRGLADRIRGTGGRVREHVRRWVR